MDLTALAYRVTPAWAIALVVPLWMFAAMGVGGQDLTAFEVLRTVARWVSVVDEGRPTAAAVGWGLWIGLSGALAWSARTRHVGHLRRVWLASLPPAACTMITATLVAGLPTTFVHTAQAPGPVAARIAALVGIGGSVSGGLVLAVAIVAAGAADRAEAPAEVPARVRAGYVVTLVLTLVGSVALWGTS